MPYEFIKDLAYLRRVLIPSGFRALPGATDDFVTLTLDLLAGGLWTSVEVSDLVTGGPLAAPAVVDVGPAAVDRVRLILAASMFISVAGSRCSISGSFRGAGATSEVFAAFTDTKSLTTANDVLALPRPRLLGPGGRLRFNFTDGIGAGVNGSTRAAFVDLPLGEYVPGYL